VQLPSYYTSSEPVEPLTSHLSSLFPTLSNDLSSQFLDLHGLYVDEALAALEDKLQSTTGTYHFPNLAPGFNHHTLTLSSYQSDYECMMYIIQTLWRVSTDQPVLYVITGKGLHSKGDARIKPAVISYLNSKAYRSAKSTMRYIYSTFSYI
jgi:hypothetical protein